MTAPDVEPGTEQANQPSAGISILALISLVLGLASTILLVITGIPALIWGYRALYQINASEGRLRGRKLAIVGMFFGGVTCVLTVFFAIFLAVLHLNAQSNRAACSNNLRQMGLALVGYQENNNNDFPAATRRGASLPFDQRLSWLTSILPYLDSGPNKPPPFQQSARDLDPEQPWNAGPNATITRPFLGRYLCPAWNLPTQAPAGETNYIGLAGVGVDAPSLPFEDYNVGFFGYDRATTTADLALKGGADGQDGPSGSSYILVSMETMVANGPWGQGGPSTCRGLSPEVRHPIGPGAPFGGLHAGGANALRADGAVHFESESIDPEVLQKVLRLRGHRD